MLFQSVEVTFILNEAVRLPKRACSAIGDVQKSGYFENIGPNWSKLGSFVDEHHTLHVIDLIFGFNGKGICNDNFSFLPMMPFLALNVNLNYLKA